MGLKSLEAANTAAPIPLAPYMGLKSNGAVTYCYSSELAPYMGLKIRLI